MLVRRMPSKVRVRPIEAIGAPRLTLLPGEELSSYPKSERCHGRGNESDIENLRCEVFLTKQQPRQ